MDFDNLLLPHSQGSAEKRDHQSPKLLEREILPPPQKELIEIIYVDTGTNNKVIKRVMIQR